MFSPGRESTGLPSFSGRSFGAAFRQGDLNGGQEGLQVAAVVGDEGQRTGAPDGQRQHGGDARHRSPATGACISRTQMVLITVRRTSRGGSERASAVSSAV